MSFWTRTRRRTAVLVAVTTLVLVLWGSSLREPRASPRELRRRAAELEASAKWRAKRDEECIAPRNFTAADLPPLPVPRPDGKTGRAIYISVLSRHRIDDFLSFFPGQERHLYAPTDSDFMLAVPANDADIITKQVVHHLNWTKVADFTPQQRAYPCDGVEDEVDHPSAGFWRTPWQVLVVLVVRNFRLPPHLKQADRTILRDPCGPLRCCPPDASRPSELSDALVDSMLDYGRYTIAYSHHLLLDLQLLDEYEWIFKIDADIQMVRDAPFPAQEFMARQGCVFMQSDINELGQYRPCYGELYPVMKSFADAHGLTPKSHQHGWCEPQNGWNLYLYSNFVGGWRPFLRSRANRALMRYLFENLTSYWKGVFDQGPWLVYLCMWYDIQYLNSEPLMCDFNRDRPLDNSKYNIWRESVFRHH